MSSPSPVTPRRPTGIPPLVFVGPTITEQEVLAVLPDAEIRPPIRRGDLYRDRMLRYSVFVVIDGVFHQHEAIPMREIVDVVRDDTWVVGASSLGALRAAECWPAGMEGVGSVYRLFRRGSLGSDDEVAVAFDPDHPHRSSVALINVRFAVSRAVRRGEIDTVLGRRIVAAAAATFYADRHWRDLLHRVAADDIDRRLEGLLSGYDVKRTDALAALRHVARRLAASPSLTNRPRRTTRPFVASEAFRERDHSALDGQSVEDVKPALARFLMASGRNRRVAADGTPDDGATDLTMTAERLWDALIASGELDAEIFRWRAVTGAAAQARRLGRSPLPVHHERADDEIARGHGCDSWTELQEHLGADLELWTWVLTHREELAWATSRRDALFRVG